MRTFDWAMEDVIAAYPHLYLDTHAATAVLLMKEAESPCEFIVQMQGFDLADLDGDREFTIRVSWTERLREIADRIEQTEQRTPIVERGAVALALLLYSHRVANSHVRVTQRHDRVDYWLPKLHRALEISGTEQWNLTERRCREKRMQVLENRLGWDGYVIVACFASSHRVIQWRYHPQQEQHNGTRE